MIDSILFFFVVFALLGWLVFELDVFGTAAGPHTSFSSSAPAPPPSSPSPSPNRRECRTLARSPPVPPAWSLLGSLLSPPRPPPLPFRHVPAAGRHDIFLREVDTVDSYGGMERVYDPVNGWKWAAVRGGRPVSPRLLPLPVSRPVTPVPVPVAPLIPAPVLAPAPPPPVAQQTPAVLPPRSLSVLERLAGIPSTPRPFLPRPAEPAPQPQLQPTATVQGTLPSNSASASLVAAPPVPPFLHMGFKFWALEQHALAPPRSGFFFEAEPPSQAPPPSVPAALVLPPSLPVAPPPPVPAVPTPLLVPVPAAPSTEAAGQSQSQVEPASAPPPPPSSGFGFGGGFGFGSAPVFGGASGSGLDFSPPIPSAPASRRGRSARSRGGSSRTIIQCVDPDLLPRIRRPDDDDNEDHNSLREVPGITHGLESFDAIWQAGFYDICGRMNRLLDLDLYLPGSTLHDFESNLNPKENGLRTLANLLRWHYESGRRMPAGGSRALADLITILSKVDGLVTGFVSENGGRQQEFNGGDFLTWARAWRYCRSHFWEAHRTDLQRDLTPAKFQQLQALVNRHVAHWTQILL